MTKNKFLCSILLAIIIATNPTISNAQELNYVAIYGDAKYGSGFDHFEYANPNAPKGGQVIFPAYGGFDNFNPFIFKGIAATQYAELAMDTLAVVPADDISTIYPLIAKSFELNDNYVSFILDEKAKFSDGSPILADDVIFSYNSLIEKGSPFYKVYYSDVKRVEKVNDKHVRFWFRPNSNNKELPLILSQIKIFSKKDWQDKDFAKPSLTPPLGSGPYILDKFSPSKYLVFRRNPNYWAKDLPSRKGFYNFDTIRYDYYQDTTVTLQALLSGNIDIREEYMAKIWVTAYDNNIVNSGKVIKKEIEHNQTARLQNFAFNIRKDKFKDKRLRKAIDHAFNFEWAKENLFYNQYNRLNSYFTNSGYEAKGLPKGKELDILNQHKDLLDKDIFIKEPTTPTHVDYVSSRNNLKKAVELLNQAGYDFVDGKMTHIETKEPLQIEIVGNAANGASFTRIMLPFLQNLKKIGIDATFKNLEVNVFKNRLDNFDFDMAIITFPISNLPGNEQKEFWGSQNANTKGSYNLIGIENPAIDKILEGLVSAQNKEDYVAHITALDRVLLNEHYMIMQWYSPYTRVAYHNWLDYPKLNTKTGFIPSTWWAKDKNK